MSDNGGGAVAAFVAIGGVYLMAESLAEVFVWLFLGLIVAIFLLVVIVGMGVVTYAENIDEAVSTKNKAWMHDLFLAPFITIVAVLIFASPFVHVAVWAANTANRLNAANPLEGIAYALAGIAILFGAPFVAVVGMSFPERVIRLSSYLGFLITGIYWGSLLLYRVRFGHLPPLKNY